MNHRPGTAALGAVVLAIGLGACSSPAYDRTAIVVTVTTDLTPRIDLDQIVIEVATIGGGNTRPSTMFVETADQLPARFGVLPSTDRRATVTVTATALLNGTSVASAKMDKTFEPDKVVTLDMRLSRSPSPDSGGTEPDASDEDADAAASTGDAPSTGDAASTGNAGAGGTGARGETSGTEGGVGDTGAGGLDPYMGGLEWR